MHQADRHPDTDPPPTYDGSMYLVGYAVAAGLGAAVGLEIDMAEYKNSPCRAAAARNFRLVPKSTT